MITAPMYRPATTHDLACAVDLRARMMEEINGVSPDVDGPAWRSRFTEFFRSRMEQGLAAIELAICDVRPIGMATVYLPVTHRTEIFCQPSAYVTSVYVEPQWRRSGIASTLMHAVVAWAKARGCLVIRLRPSSIGKPLYDALGFAPSGELELRLST
jgi:GNAT superfamily N-acetyltransferase